MKNFKNLLVEKPTTETVVGSEVSKEHSMNNQELFQLIKNSKLAQVATPLASKMRGASSRAVPTHQVIYTPKSSAIRSNFGMKSYLPKQIGSSHIIYNDIDNKKNMPDVEKYSGSMYNRLKFQETGAVVKNYFADTNPLFPHPSTMTKSTNKGNASLLTLLNLTPKSSVADVKKLMNKNPNLYANFQKWLLHNNPDVLATGGAVNQQLLLKNLKEFLKVASDESVFKYQVSLEDFTRKKGKKSNFASVTNIQGSAGFSYAQKGRFNNTPNGIKHGSIAPGRIVSDREAAIGGFVARLNERTTSLANNYANNFAGKHKRQFTLPFKITEAEITPTGNIRVYADGVKVGSWLQNTKSVDVDRSNYQPSNPRFGNASERNGRDNIALQNLMNLISH